MKTNLLTKYLFGYLIAFTMFIPTWATAQENKSVEPSPEKEDSVQYYISRGQQLDAEQKFAEALKAFENARKFDPANETAILGQMSMNFRLGRIEDGLKVIEEWTTNDPGNANAWRNLAGYSGVLSQEEVALRAVDKLTGLQPDSASSWILKAQLMMQFEHYEEAGEASDRAIALDRKAEQAWYMKAYALAGLEKFDEAIHTCNLAVENLPDAAEAYYTRACIYSRSGDKAHALADLQSTIEMDSTFKARAQADPDFKNLHTDENFMTLTGMARAEVLEYASMDSVCSIQDKEYTREDFIRKVTGSWKATKAYMRGQNVLGERNFYFTFRQDGTIEIKEPESNWIIKGTWEIGQNKNSLQWVMPDKNNSFQGKYDFLGQNMILSGMGFVGEYEYICLRLKAE